MKVFIVNFLTLLLNNVGTNDILGSHWESSPRDCQIPCLNEWKLFLEREEKSEEIDLSRESFQIYSRDRMTCVKIAIRMVNVLIVPQRSGIAVSDRFDCSHQKNQNWKSTNDCFYPQDTMDQLKRVQTMDGISIICPQLMMDSAKIPPPIFVEGRPKRQRPTHQGKCKNIFHSRQTSINFNWTLNANLCWPKSLKKPSNIFSSPTRPGRMRESMEGSGAKTKDPVQLQKRLGLFSGVALIAGTMIGNAK